MKKVVKKSAKKITATVLAGATLLSNFTLVSAIPTDVSIRNENSKPALHLSSESIKKVINKNPEINATSLKPGADLEEKGGDAKPESKLELTTIQAQDVKSPHYQYTPDYARGISWTRYEQKGRFLTVTFEGHYCNVSFARFVIQNTTGANGTFVDGSTDITISRRGESVYTIEAPEANDGYMFAGWTKSTQFNRGEHTPDLDVYVANYVKTGEESFPGEILEDFQEDNTIDEEMVHSYNDSTITKENDETQDGESESLDIEEDVISEMIPDNYTNENTTESTEAEETMEPETPAIGVESDVTDSVEETDDFTEIESENTVETAETVGKTSDEEGSYESTEAIIPEIKFDAEKLSEITPKVEEKLEINTDLSKLEDTNVKVETPTPEIKFDTEKLVDIAVEEEVSNEEMTEVSSHTVAAPLMENETMDSEVSDENDITTLQEENTDLVMPEGDEYADEKENGYWKKPKNNIWTNVTKKESDYSTNNKITVHYEGAHVYVSFAKFKCDLEMCDGFNGNEEITVGRRGGSDYEITAPRAKDGYRFSHWTKTTITETTYANGTESSFSYDIYTAVYIKEIDEVNSVVKSQYKLYSTDSTITVNPRITIKTNLSEEDLKKYGTENEPGSGIIWWVEFTCDMEMCEGFDQHFSANKNATVLEGRRGSSDLTMTAPKAKAGYHFVRWEEYQTNYKYNGEAGVKGYRAIYELDD